ncbi:hypothetical protein HY065_02645, partial [Candidatus Berkelbacteria bacterium]|nr:hypothetical protein [Candidatus Berkelbacteria bacterium]
MNKLPAGLCREVMTVAQKPLITLSEGKVGQVLNLAKHAIRKSGVSDEVLECLIEKRGEFQDEFSKIVRRFGSSFQYDLREEGWTLLEDAERKINSAAALELVAFLKEGETVIGGEELVSRARTELRANYGQHDAEWLVKHQEEIPVEFRKFYLVFTGTVWRDRNGNQVVAYLRWNGERWDLLFRWLD